MSKKLISFISPFYNCSTYVPISFLSMIYQNHDNFEILLLDDASTDDSLKIILMLKKRFSKIQIRIYKNHKNKGIAYSLNKLIRKSNSSIIARHDMDDISINNRLTSQLDSLDKNHDLIGSHAYNFDNDLIVGKIGLSSFNYKPNFLNFINGIPIPHPSWMVKKEFFINNHYSSFNRSEDQQILIRNRNKFRFGCIQNPLIFYRLGKLNFLKEINTRFSLLLDLSAILLSEKKFLILVLIIAFHIGKISIFVLIYLFKLDFILSRYKRTSDEESKLLINYYSFLYNQL